MWIRSDLKMKAKQAFKKNYWAAVVVSLILAVILASGGSSGNNDKDNLSIPGIHKVWGKTEMLPLQE